MLLPVFILFCLEKELPRFLIYRLILVIIIYQRQILLYPLKLGLFVVETILRLFQKIIFLGYDSFNIINSGQIILLDIKIPKKDIVTRTGASRTLIDTTGERFQNSPGLQHWASVKNLKTAAASYAAADNLSDLQKQIDDKTTEAKSARTELVKLEHQMKKVSEFLLYAEQYRDNIPFQEKYKKSKDPDRYLRIHETQLILYDGAERMLRKATLERTYKSAERDAKDIQQKLNNVEQFLEADKFVVDQPRASHQR